MTGNNLGLLIGFSQHVTDNLQELVLGTPETVDPEKLDQTDPEVNQDIPRAAEETFEDVVSPVKFNLDSDMPQISPDKNDFAPADVNFSNVASIAFQGDVLRKITYALDGGLGHLIADVL